MPPRPAPLLLLGVALGVFLPGGCCGSPSHSLRYHYLKVSEPSQGLTQLFVRGYLDDQPITHYDNHNGTVVPLVPWMEKAEKKRYLAPDWVFSPDLMKLSELNHPTEGLHIWQVILGCDDGNKGGVFRYGYNGSNFTSFENETWVTAQPQAEKVKEIWVGDQFFSLGIKGYLEKICIQWLQNYLSYRKKTLEDTENPRNSSGVAVSAEPPVGKVTHKMVDDSLEVLICQAFGFHPKEMQATWRRDGEVWKDKTLQRNVTPNSDGTYYLRLSIEIDPKERDRFQCHLEHEGLQEPLVLAFKKKTGSLSHSLSYFYLRLPEPSQGPPQFSIRSYLDDQPIAHFGSLTRKMEPLVPWMEEKENFLAPERVFRADLEKLSKLSHQSEGLHTWQAVWGCELRDDGSKGGYFHYGYDGMDFISFDKETLRWVTTQPQKVKEEWEEDPRWSEKMKELLKETCIEWLQRYLSYQKEEAVQRIEPPVGKVNSKVVDERLEVLTCQAFGFYPEEIHAIWTRDGEACNYETLHGNVAPNSDGTFYVQLSIEIDPKERDCFRCHLEHEGLQEPLVLALKEETATTRWALLGVPAAVILGAGILFLIGWRWRCRKKHHREETTCPDQVSLEKLSSPPSAEDEIQSQEMLHPAITEGWRWRCRKKHHQEETTCPDDVSPESLPSPPSAEDEIQLQVMLHPAIT